MNQKTINKENSAAGLSRLLLSLGLGGARVHQLGPVLHHTLDETFRLKLSEASRRQGRPDLQTLGHDRGSDQLDGDDLQFRTPLLQE